MICFDINGGQPLNGTIRISGSKNAALPAMTAALLSDQPTRLTNVPAIRDVQAMAEILKATGAFIDQIDQHTWEISGRGLSNTDIEYLLGRRLRASILLLGPLLTRFGKIKLPHPGGCVIGKRPVGIHFDALREMGATIEHEGDFYLGVADRLVGASLYLDEISVTATENVIMAAVLAAGQTTIRPAAMEPHVVNLCQLLVAMGAKISGIGTHTLIIDGVDALKGTEHQIVSDEIETGTYAVAAAITNGQLTLTNIPPDLDPIIHKLGLVGVKCELTDSSLVVSRDAELKATNLQVDTWPRFPTDLQPQFGVLLTQANGQSSIHEWMYENRLRYTESLAKMGATVSLPDVHHAEIVGPTPLHGATIDSPDLRSGIAFVLAALAASGHSTIRYAELILRGYEDLVGKLKAVGADIEQSGQADTNSKE